ncbi:MAG: biotin/lipoyl-containing protein [Elusimicrobiota bacterium]
MDKKELKDVMDWARTTDLVELEFRRDGHGFSFSKRPKPQTAVCGFPGRNLAAVPSPGVGVFQWNTPGSPRLAAEGAQVSAGTTLGIVEGAGTPKKVEAPCGGILQNVCVDAGQTVQYGQPLFFIDRKD